MRKKRERKRERESKLQKRKEKENVERCKKWMPTLAEDTAGHKQHGNKAARYGISRGISRT